MDFSQSARATSCARSTYYDRGILGINNFLWWVRPSRRPSVSNSTRHQIWPRPAIIKNDRPVWIHSRAWTIVLLPNPNPPCPMRHPRLPLSSANINKIRGGPRRRIRTGCYLQAFLSSLQALVRLHPTFTLWTGLVNLPRGPPPILYVVFGFEPAFPLSVGRYF